MNIPIQQTLVKALNEIPTERNELSQWHKNITNALHNQFIRDNVTARDLVSLITGLLCFTQTGLTPESSHLDMINSYCKTNGLTHEIISGLLSKKDRRTSKELYNSMDPTESKCTQLPDFFYRIQNDELFNEIDKNLDKFGYVVFNKIIPSNFIHELYKRISELPLIQYFIDGASDKQNVTLDKHTDRGILDLDLTTLDYSPLHELIRTPLLAPVIGHLLGGQYELYKVSFRRTYSIDIIGDFAQAYHYDLDSHDFCKIFVYLNDVTDANGAHSYIPGSHRPGSKSYDLIRSAGYRRISDKDILEFESHTPQLITGGPGTIFVGNTKCWHKGGTVESGHRDMITYFFSKSKYCSNFGN